MAQDSISASQSVSLLQHAAFLDALYEEAQGARWGLSREGFAEGLRRSADRRFRGTRASATEVDAYLKSLHLEDLALACACVEGIEEAWEFFVVHFRQELRDASRAIFRSSGSGNDARATELADSLYAELYGIGSTGGGRRKSLFEYFHGRSKLSTWLRAILAQRHVDLIRASRATVSLDADADDRPIEMKLRTESAPSDPDRANYVARIDRALSTALAALLPRERLLLACYYVDQLTLAEIGKTLREHESTVSRQLDRARRTLRETVTEILRRGAPWQDGNAADPGMDESQLEVAFEYALEDWSFDLSRALSKAEAESDPPE